MADQVPAEAVEAAEAAMRDEMRASRDIESGRLAQVALEAGAPAIRAAERERIAKLAERVGATRTERCRDPAHAAMVHAIRAVGSGGGHEVPFADLLRDEVARRAEELHAEHHPGYIVPSLDSCNEHDRAAYERMIRDMLERP